MKLEDRLGAHFADVTEEMTSPPARLEAVVSAGSSQGFLGRILLAAAIGAVGLIGLGLTTTTLGDGVGPNYSNSVDSDPNPNRVVVSPFVNTRSRLQDQTNVELFTVTSSEPTYWRIAGLDTYEDDIWKIVGDFVPANGELPGQIEFGGQVSEVTQTFTIKSLAAIWLPAAFNPSEIVESTEDITWNAETSSLTVTNDIENSDDVTYTVVSRIPAFSVEQLRAAPESIPTDIADRYLNLPPDLTPQVPLLADRVTSDFSTQYDKMRALQDHFRAYSYNVDLEPREGDPIEQFLNEEEGFAQQFSGTFALMARSLGVPARVATGFTWGNPVATDPATGLTTYSVTSEQTHAWPEVYFDGLGWVAFEPTPSRGLPGAANYTGVPAAQASDIQPND